MTAAKKRVGTRLLVLASIALGAPAACNVFVSLDRCESDDDCNGGTCDPAGKFCIRPVTPDSAADAPVDVADAGVDAPVGADAEPPKCDPTTKFGGPVLVAGLESLAIANARLLSDERSILYSALNGGVAESDYDIFFAARADGGAFGAGLPFANINVPTASEYFPNLSSNGLWMFFESSRSVTKIDGGYTNDQPRIWTAQRRAIPGDFDQIYVQDFFQTTGAGAEGSPFLNPSATRLYFMSDRRGDAGNAIDLYEMSIDDTGGVYDLTNLGPGVNTELVEINPVVSADDMTIYFARYGKLDAILDMFVSTRATPTAQFPTARPVAELNGKFDETPAWLSPDRCRLYFTSNRPVPSAPADAGPGDYHLWIASRTPPN